MSASKKLKQACLPFKLVNSPGDENSSKCRKRKLSGTENSETQVENSKVELVNGGTKCFIKSDDKNINNHEFQELCKDVSNSTSVNKSVNSIESSEANSEKSKKEIDDLEISNVDDNVMDIDDETSSSNSLDASNLVENNTSVISNSDGGKSENTTPSSKKMTPAQILKRQQASAKKQEERLRLKEEKERIRVEKLAEKQRMKDEKRNAENEAKRLRELEKEKEKKQKEEEKKQKEEEKKQKEEEKERERKQKEEEKKAKELEKEKEKKQKEEEKKAKELEKEKQKEEKLLREEMEKKKNEKVKAAFVGFFKPKNLNVETSKKNEVVVNQEQETYFMPFQTKQDMKIAPFCRALLNSERKEFVDKCINKCDTSKDLLYLSLLKTGKYKPLKTEATWPNSVEDEEDVIIIETGATDNENVNKIGSSLKNNSQKYCWKLLQFHENRRPPYCGTWRKKSLCIKPRRPFACDQIMFDYEVDSDDEWEEEDPGESIHGTDDEVEPEDDYEVDNDVFVPHGYLSDEEGEGQCDDDVPEEVQKEKLKLLGEEFEAEIKKKTERIKPRLVGCIWIPNNVTNPENMSKSVADTLLKYRCIWDGEEPIITEAPISEDSPKNISVSENKKKYLPDAVIPDLITFVHGNTNGIKVAAKNFIDELIKNGQNVDDSSINLSSVRRAIKTVATKSTPFAPWNVGKENFEKYGVEYPKVVENETLKSAVKSSVTKITSFMTPQSHKAKPTLFEKSCLETDKDTPLPEKKGLTPKSLFNIKNNPKLKDAIKEEQKINIIGGKKRITPVLVSPKKTSKPVVKQSKEKSLSPEKRVIIDEETLISNDKTV